MQLYQQPESGYVYLVWAIGTERYKIGRSKDPSRRVQALSKQSCYPLKLIDSHYSVDCEQHEKRLHNIFWQHRVHGEWFEIPEVFLSQLDYWLKDPNCLHIKLTGKKTGAIFTRKISPGRKGKGIKKESYILNKSLDWEGILSSPDSLERAITLLGNLGKGMNLSSKTRKEILSLVGINPTTREEATELKQQLKGLRGSLNSSQLTTENLGQNSR